MSDLYWTTLDSRAVDTARALAADAVDKAGNGHPGTAISLAPAAYLLYQKMMRHDPSNPRWLGRDRLVLSLGHSSLTLYTQLFLAGYGLEVEDLEQLRQWGSATPGHPEFGHTPGVEMTTGPLGQGLASAVGMAMEARRVRGMLDADTAPGTSPFDHYVYVLVGDGCLQEGVTAEACSLAGTQELGNLIVIYDDNSITIEGDPQIAFTEDVLKRYESYGWHTQHVDWRASGAYHEDLEALADALEAAQAEHSRPSIIKLSTIMAWPAPNVQGTAKPHGNALGAEETAALKEAMGMDPSATFAVEDAVLAHTRANAQERAAAARQEWEAAFEAWKAGHPREAELLARLESGALPQGWEEALPHFDEPMATRAASGAVLNALAPVLPELWGGSADLAGSNNTAMAGEDSFLPTRRANATWPGNPYGRNLHFGIREHAMGAIVNGISLSGLTRAYGGTFFVFADYMRPAVRLAALMGVPAIYVWTHDSIGVGEDGPTHQPIEHLWAYRAIPNFALLRPADANETAYAWKALLERTDGPAGIVLTRQKVPVLEGTSSEGVARGGYVIAETPTGAVDVQILATGSEVQLALEARSHLASEGIGVRVISLPCLEWFAEQSEEYRASVILPHVKARVAVEAGATFGWASYVGDAGECVGIDHFGASAPAGTLFEEFGITAEAVAQAARQALAKARS